MINTLPAHIAGKIKAEADRLFNELSVTSREKSTHRFTSGAEFGYSLRDKEGWVRWVKPSENNLPDDGQSILIFTKSGVRAGFYYWSQGYNPHIFKVYDVDGASYLEISEVILWAPLPSPLDESPAPPAGSTSSPQEGEIKLKVCYWGKMSEEYLVSSIMAGIKTDDPQAHIGIAPLHPAPDAGRDKEAQPGVSDAVGEGLTVEQIKAIEDMADRTFELCKMEENLLRDAYPLIESFRLRAPAKDTSFTKRAVEQWLKDYQLFKSNNKQGRNG